MKVFSPSSKCSRVDKLTTLEGWRTHHARGLTNSPCSRVGELIMLEGCTKQNPSLTKLQRGSSSDLRLIELIFSYFIILGINTVSIT